MHSDNDFCCSAIVACNEVGAIGLKGKLMYTIPGDLINFKRLTMGHYVIVGRTTYESIPNRLPGRKIILLTRNINYTCTVHKDIITKTTIEEAITFVRDHCREVFVIGGASVYEQAKQYINKIYMTYVHDNKYGDKYFRINDESEWNTHVIKSGTFGGLEYDYRITTKIYK